MQHSNADPTPHRRATNSFPTGTLGASALPDETQPLRNGHPTHLQQKHCGLATLQRRPNATNSFLTGTLDASVLPTETQPLNKKRSEYLQYKYCGLATLQRGPNTSPTTPVEKSGWQ